MELQQSSMPGPNTWCHPLACSSQPLMQLWQSSTQRRASLQGELTVMSRCHESHQMWDPNRPVSESRPKAVVITSQHFRLGQAPHWSQGLTVPHPHFTGGKPEWEAFILLALDSQQWSVRCWLQMSNAQHITSTPPAGSSCIILWHFMSQMGHWTKRTLLSWWGSQSGWRGYTQH